MSLLETAYVFSTGDGQVYLAKGIDPDEAQDHLESQLDDPTDTVIHYEGKLSDWQRDLRVDGIALLNP